MQQQLYYTLQYDRDLLNSSATLIDFSVSGGQNSFGYMFRIDEALFNGEYSAAQDLVNEFSPINTVDENYKNYYNLYIQYATQSIDTVELTELYAIAEKCPLTDGEIVYAARALYNLLSQSSDTFNTACSNIGYRMVNTTVKETKVTKALLFPNPTNGVVNISFANSSSGRHTISIIDALGKQVMSRKCDSGIPSTTVTLTNAGLYIVRITNSETGITETQKLIVTTK